MDKIMRNRQFLESIFKGDDYSRPGLVCMPLRQVSLWELGDYTLSSRSINNWLSWVVDDYHAQVKLLEELDDDSVPIARIIGGTHIFAQAFGAKVYEYPDSLPAAMPLVATAEKAGKLTVPDIWSCPGLMRIFELAKLVEKELGTDVPLGPCDMQSGFDIAAQLWDKEDFLCTMLLEPEAVKTLAGKCAELLKTFLAELRREFPQMSPCHCPGTWMPPHLGPWVSNDECGVINAAAFEEFVLPELIDLSKTFGGLGMHCCANAEHQCEAVKKIPNFYGFNRVAGKQGKGYLPLLEHFSGPTAPVHVLAWLTDDEINQLLNTAPTETRFIFNAVGVNAEEGRRWLDKISNRISHADCKV
jgi:hypothetical protein